MELHFLVTRLGSAFIELRFVCKVLIQMNLLCELVKYYFTGTGWQSKI